MYDIHNGHAVLAQVVATLTTTGSPSQVTTPTADLQFDDAVEVIALIGSVDELGGSPVGSSKADLKLYHSDDDITFTEVALADVVGPSSVTAGVVATTTLRFTSLKAGYRGGKRYLQAALVGTTLTNGGPVAIAIYGRQIHQGGDAV